MNEMPILHILLCAGAIAGILLYAHGFAAGVWPFSSTAPADRRQGRELYEVCPECGAPERRRNTRARAKVAELHDALSCGMLSSDVAAKKMKRMRVPLDVAKRVIGSVQP